MIEKVEQEIGNKEIPVEWHIGDQVISRYATNMIVQTTDHEFILSFFEISPPIVLTQEDIEQLERGVRAECIARIIVAKAKMPRFIEALQTNLERTLSKAEEEQK